MLSKEFRYQKKKVERDALLLAKRVRQRWTGRSSTGQPKQVIFVAGVQRSGTNMMMDVIERSFATDVYHESDPRAFTRYEMHSPQEIHRLVTDSPAPYVAIKSLCELQDLKALLDEFAPAKAVWMVRDYEDVVNSHLVLWHKTPQFLGQIVADRNSARWRGRGMSDQTHALVSRLYHPDISNASASALFWYFRNVLFFEQHLDQDDRVQPMRYEMLVTDPQRQFARLFDWFGLDYTRRISSKVFASSVRKQPPPEIEPAIRDLCDELTARFNALF